jgi:murein DD-endopeptidase MepM/ murein hydrolase activator NlpD
MRRTGVAVAAAVFSAAALLGVSGRWPWHRLGGARLAPAVVAPPPVPTFTETHDTLRRGETLSDLFGRHDISIDFHRLDPSLLLDPRRVRAGLIFSFRRMLGDSVPSHISVRTSPDQRITFSRVANGWSAEAEPIRWQAQEARIEGVIDNSLYEALDEGVTSAQLDVADRRRLAWNLADVYAWQVDFTRDIQPGDSFRVVFQRLVSEDGEVRVGPVLAGDLTISGKSLTAFRFGGENGRAALYYDAAGNSLRRAFLRAPVEFRRISSNFARLRFHPILGLARRHEGTDYAAAPGTPVMAAGDGVVLRAGRAGGYGNLIELRHLNGITTRYGHLRGFARNIRAGARVQQGQVIGYVGSTGLATGPHLHYEFRVNGIPQDSRRVNLGSGAPVPAADRTAFDQERDRLLLRLQQPDSTNAAVPALAGQAAETPTRWLP